MKCKILVMLFTLITQFSYAQSMYKIDSVLYSDPTKVCINIKIYVKSKKSIGKEAAINAIRAVLFDGIEGTCFAKPLLSQGEQVSKQQFPIYFNELFDTNYSDFIGECTMCSKFRKADKGNATMFRVEVKTIQLRKDLEKNKIRKIIAF